MSSRSSTTLPENVACIINELIQLIKKKKLAIFCGAGICLNPPSNLPTARQMRKAILSYLNIGESLPDEVQTLLEEGIYVDQRSVGDNEEYSDLTRYYPFEAFIQSINGNAPILETLQRIYTEGEPNKNHLLLANLLMKGYVKEIMTTNFDTKLEDAMKQVTGSDKIQGEKPVDLRVIYKEEDFLRDDIVRSAYPVIWKLHGTIDDPSSLRMTLELIASKQLREARARILRHFFDEVSHDILILGYSCSDEFDINPVLRDIESTRRIFFVNHRPREVADLPEIRDLEDPFHKFHGRMILCYTDDLINCLWKKFVGTPFSENPRSTTWTRLIDEWNQRLQKGQRTFTMAQLLFAIQEYSFAENLFRQTLKIKENLEDQYGIFISLYQLAMSHYVQGNYKEAEELFKRSLKIKKKDPYVRSKVFHQLGMIYQRYGDLKKAERLYQKSLKIDQRQKKQDGIASTLHQLATLQLDQKNYERAEDLYRLCYESWEQLGNQLGMGHSLHLLARIKEMRRDYEAAERLYWQSIEIAKRLSDQRGMAASLHQLAGLQIMRENYETAERLCQECFKIDKQLGDQVGIATSLHMLGYLAEIRGDLSNAANCYEKAWKLSQKVGQSQSEIQKSKDALERIRSMLKEKSLEP